MLSHQPRHGGRQDELGGGLDPRVALPRDRGFRFDFSVPARVGDWAKIKPYRDCQRGIILAKIQCAR